MGLGTRLVKLKIFCCMPRDNLATIGYSPGCSFGGGGAVLFTPILYTVQLFEVGNVPISPAQFPPK